MDCSIQNELSESQGDRRQVGKRLSLVCFGVRDQLKGQNFMCQFVGNNCPKRIWLSDIE